MHRPNARQASISHPRFPLRRLRGAGSLSHQVMGVRETPGLSEPKSLPYEMRSQVTLELVTSAALRVEGECRACHLLQGIRILSGVQSSEERPCPAASALPVAGAGPGEGQLSAVGPVCGLSSALTSHSLSQKVVTALDRTWHPEHFFCAQCGAFFGPEGMTSRLPGCSGTSGRGALLMLESGLYLWRPSLCPQNLLLRVPRERWQSLLPEGLL